jgi:IS1 family transposase
MRLRVGRAIGKNENEAAMTMMSQLRDRCNTIESPAIANDGSDSYLEAMLETCGKAPEYCGRGRSPTCREPHAEWKCLQITEHQSGWRMMGITCRVIYGNRKEVLNLMALTAYVEGTNLASRQMDGRIIRKTLSFSREEEMLEASCA